MKRKEGVGRKSDPKSSPVGGCISRQRRGDTSHPPQVQVSPVFLLSLLTVPTHLLPQMFPISTKRREREIILGFSLKKGREVIM